MSLRHTLHGVYKGVAEAILPPRSSAGGFRDTGLLTPDEFVAAGDFLVATCPTWAWQGGERSRQKSYLPPDKQYLITRNVPCFKRAAAVEDAMGAAEAVLEEGEGGAGDDGDGWLAPSMPSAGSADAARDQGDASGSALHDADAAIPSMDEEPAPGAAAAEASAAQAGVAPSDTGATAASDEEDAADIPDMDSFDAADNLVAQMAAAAVRAGGGGGGAKGGDDEEDDAAALPYLVAKEPEDNILRTRSYDVSVSYDKYYQTPRIWLTGYDEHRAPLSPGEALQDVSHEHARKTVTVDGHPHTGVPAVSIHPCRHGAVMKKIADQMAEGGADPRVEHYLFIFLRFCQTAVPTIEYDFTVSMG